MSEEMAVSDNATGEDGNTTSADTALEDAVEAMDGPAAPELEETAPEPESLTNAEDPNAEPDTAPEVNIDIKHEVPVYETKIQQEDDEDDLKDEIKDEFEAIEHHLESFEDEEKKGIKRRMSEAFSDEGDEFKGFDDVKQEIAADDYSQVLERLEAEVSAARKSYTPVRVVMATPSAPVRASKRPRKDTAMSDSSRPSSAQSSRSEDDNPSASPAQRGRRTAEMWSPLLRVPLDRGWKRELVYRAALDAHSRRNADIYYYTPQGKKLRSTREVSEHLSGTGLTLENFSFFKEPLGVDDPEKEIIRDAKLMRRMDSPLSSPAPVQVEGKRTPKPKPPKGASPEPTTPKSPPAKLKVKSLGSRVASAPAAPNKQQKKPAAAPAPAPTPSPATTPTTNDNNNSAAWKKPRAPPPADRDDSPPPAAAPPASAPPAPASAPPAPPAPAPHTATAPANRPAPAQASAPPPPVASSPETPRSCVQPCSLVCGAGVPSLACSACLCLYHPACAGVGDSARANTHNFLCKNCRKSSPPRRSSSGGAGGAVGTGGASVTTPTTPGGTPRVVLRMRVCGGGAGGGAGAGAGGAGRVWAVAEGARPLPQSLACLNGRRFIVVPRPPPTNTPNTHA